MFKLPDLPEPKQRKLELLWLDLTEERGFTGDHLQWSESKERRHRAAAPGYSLAPPPATPIGDRVTHSRTSYRGPNGEEISWREWQDRELAAWRVREHDTRVLDSIGVAETISLAGDRFAQLASVYFGHWSEQGGARFEEFGVWLEEITAVVEREVAGLWVLRGDWFSCVCSQKMAATLKRSASDWVKQARDLERSRIEAPPVVASPSQIDSGASEPAPDPEPAPALTKGRPASLANGPDIAAATWQDIEIFFLSDERVEIRNAGKVETRNYHELGFADRRVKRGEVPKPNRAWGTLRAMSEREGIIPDGASTGEAWEKVEKRIQEIRKVLRMHFDIAADPIPFIAGTGYQTLFKIGRRPSFYR